MVLPVLLCVAVGFVLAKLHQPFDGAMIGPLLANVGYPALILSHLAGSQVQLSQFAMMMLASLCVMACFGGISLVFLKAVGLPARGFVSPMMLNNTGNIGIPVCLLAFGSNGMHYALAFAIVVIVGIFTIGMWMPQGKVTAKTILTSPIIYSVALALVLMGTGWQLPGPIKASIDILGGLAIPLLLLTLGHALATLKLGAVWRGAYLSVFHLGMAAAVAFVLDQLFGFEGVARGAFIVLCLMPVSVTAYLFIEMYRPKDAPAVATFVLISTILMVLILPLVLTYWVGPQYLVHGAAP